MKLKKYYLPLLAALAVLIVWKLHSRVETNILPAASSQPTQAQPKLPTIKLWLGSEELAAEMALTPQQEQIGMMFRTNILETDAMIFVLPFPQRASFWMKNCPESISAAYVDPDGVIQEIRHLEKNDTNAVTARSANILYVLETSEGWFARHNVATGTVIRTERGTLAETFIRR